MVASALAQQRPLRLLPLLVLAFAATRALGQYEYDYGYGYDFYDAEDDFYYDEYGYYGNEDEAYYEYYGYYTDDFAGYEDYYEEYESFQECFFDDKNKPVLANGTASCDIKIQGVDKQADKLKGGLDGVYQLESCFNGKPMYKRKNSPAGEDRVLWYSSTFGDWDISTGSDPNDAEILMYGGEMEHAAVPLFVSYWRLDEVLTSDTAPGEDDHLPINVQVKCADGSKPDPIATAKVQNVNALTPAEMEMKYGQLWEQALQGRPEPSPTINFTFVVLLVMTGLTVVLAIPYFLLRKKNAKSSISMSFAQMLSQSKKKQTGHIN